MRKRCSKCKKNKNKNSFWKSSKSKSKFTSWCILCFLRYRETRREEARKYGIEYRGNPNNKKKIKGYLLQHKYGITIKEYDIFKNRQNNKCAICEVRGVKGKKLGVDHCHKTGKIRGLLCDRCNLVLGKINDDVMVAKKIIKYLQNN